MRAADVASWRTEPGRLADAWQSFRQVDPEWPALYHNTGEPVATQESGRWHRLGEGYAQYLSLSPLGAWAEWARYESIRSAARAREQRRNLWVVHVVETEIANLQSFDHLDRCGLDPRLAVGDHAASQRLADDLRVAGFRGVLAPSAALPGVLNLTVFGPRYEKVLVIAPSAWDNPDPEAWLPCTIASEAGPMPSALTTETVFRTKPHEGYRAWLKAAGRPMPSGPP